MTTGSGVGEPLVAHPHDVHLSLIGGPTVLIETGGLRLLTDPSLDPPGEHPIGARSLTKLTAPAVTADGIGHLDAVLLSHDQHPDNLDDAGRVLLTRVPRVLTTATAAERIGGQTETVPLWRHTTVARPDGGDLVVTGVPAQHGPDGTQSITGDVMGFVLSGDGLPTVYVSGDNASLNIVREIAFHCGPLDGALLFAGAARTPLLDAYLTLDSRRAAQAAAILDATWVAVVHTEGWAHFTEGPSDVLRHFRNAGLEDRLVTLEPGARTRTPGP